MANFLKYCMASLDVDICTFFDAGYYLEHQFMSMVHISGVT